MGIFSPGYVEARTSDVAVAQLRQLFVNKANGTLLEPEFGKG